MKIGIAYDLKDELSPRAILNTEACEEYDTEHTIGSICGVFERYGHKAVKLGSGLEIVDRIKEEKAEFVFNIAEGFGGRNRESHVPAILEMMGVPYSGSDPLALAMTLDKTITKKIAYLAGIPTPRYRVVMGAQDLQAADRGLRYPLVTKPAWEGSSKGIYNSSKVPDKGALEQSLARLFIKYPDQPVLVEEYIRGREVTVGLIGNGRPRVLGIMEIAHREGRGPSDDFFYSLEVKRDWENLVDYICPAKLSCTHEKLIKCCAMRAFEEFGCRDVARIDFRISGQGNVYMLELNPLPGLSPLYADLVIMAEKQGMKYDDLVMSILQSALTRCGLAKKSEELVA